MHRHLHTYFPDYFTDGAIFSKMENAPWFTAGVGLDMDIAYLASYSGNKIVAYFINVFIDSETSQLNQQKLADVIWNIYGKNWQRLWDALSSEYDPLNNYDVTENTIRNLTNDRDITKDTNETRDSTTKDKLDSENTVNQNGTTTSSGTEKVDFGKITNNDSDQKDYRHGFNSLDDVPTTRTISTSTETQSGSDTTTTSGSVATTNNSTDTLDSTDTITTNITSTIGDTTKDNQVEDENIQRTRKGNIGQNTYQELLRQEFELWKWNFYNQVFSDCDRLLVLSVHSECC